ncbi:MULTISPECIES: cupin domain-containing protein [Bradyrhizobium]|uniref:cupin domain-containing protein n=1 Tax=Bradyrhizobium TaxID=374 RepID=UPI0008414BB2|nr:MULTISPECIES: cupin domain-containing protein [Bradyrhizobium]MCP1838213.1 mannose-6-phosphate isomerase-like protein (cupin superfamily) [Bradyrhizobium sp. USDA 4538]MCP1898776.1 mannose-6-phosphate isomerase-like protein (cupin superfamily) [Bradyrhizobium sp. USDA 4537]MCP1909277.1 mannose-6-phosphate isomerase-like protein (cupin superfamily) [Bradyrhizobium elkanii]MCP1987112.1 mannose-6-phosphate isomerase-like protein (cupin superfamily) [Bradyrhizobium sp. USDA 4539]ODM76395.1 hypo
MKNAQLMILGEMTVYSPGVVLQPVRDSETACPVELIEFRLDPFAVSAPHSHPSCEIWRITSGHGRVITDDGELAIKAGDMVFLQPDRTHYLENRGGEVLSALSIAWERAR